MAVQRADVYVEWQLLGLAVQFSRPWATALASSALILWAEAIEFSY